MKYTKDHLNSICENGYCFSYFAKGIYVFTKKLEKGFEVIKANLSDIENNNISFMFKHGLSR